MNSTSGVDRPLTSPARQYTWNTPQIMGSRGLIFPLSVFQKIPSVMEDCIWEVYTIVNQWECGGDLLIPYLDYQFQSQSSKIGKIVETVMIRFDRLLTLSSRHIQRRRNIILCTSCKWFDDLYNVLRANITNVFFLSARQDSDGPRRQTAMSDLPMNGGYGKFMWAGPVANTVMATVDVDIRPVRAIKDTQAPIACMIDSLIL